ncbi:MAG: hypothetical protein EHM61_01090 [Acidobacteria bacterium]|nr:MAG: hypothetical protein EHM61_01090 [Acidobacteriota bacterium]
MTISLWVKSFSALTGTGIKPSSPGLARLKLLLLGVVLAAAIGERALHLDAFPLWVDEAESCINALTILDHGYPTDSYMGLPIYENTLVQPWPESEEYEFRDISYSAKGMAVYHGWLPLYSIAGAFWLGGIKPDHPTETLQVRHSGAEMLFRTRVGRSPALVFSLLFLLALFFGARRIFNETAGWVALLLGGFSHLYVWYGGQARYYSATLALNALCLLLAWLMLTEGKWRHFVTGGLVFVLLFHTHMLSFLAGAIMVLGTVPFLWRHVQALLKIGVFGALILAGTVPWALWTGFLDHATGIPMAWSILEFPAGILDPILRRHNLTFPLLCGALWLPLSVWLKSRFPDRFPPSLSRWRAAIVFLVAWMVVNFLAFTFLVPAASYFYFRLVLGLVAPGILCSAGGISALARLLWPRRTVLVSFALVVVFFASWAHLPFRPWDPCPRSTFQAPVLEMVEQLRGKTFRPGTRIYSTPNEHLTLTFYSGLPIQSVAPVRKSFLDNHPEEVVILECFPRYGRPPLSPDEVFKAAKDFGHQINRQEARRISNKLRHWMTAAHAEERGARVYPASPGHDPLFQRLSAIQASLEQEYLKEQYSEPTAHALWRGYPMEDLSSFWLLFFYRFVDPEKRIGPHLNYAGRIKGSHASVLNSKWVIYESPRLSTSLCVAQKCPEENPAGRHAALSEHQTSPGGGYQ